MGQNPYPVEIAGTGGGPVKTAGDLTFTDPGNQPGGSMPSWWTIVDTPGSESATLAGRLIVTAPGQDKTLVVVGDKDSANDAFVITDSDNPGSIALGIDPFGYISALGIAVSGGDVRLLEVDAVLAGRTNRVVSIVGGITDLLVIDKDGDIQLGNLPSSAPAKSKTLWNNSGALSITA
jgi:hypothetical protein